MDITSRSDASLDEDYERRLQQEIEHFKSVTNVTDLPEICYYWLDGYVRPKLKEVFGVTELFDVYVKYILQFAGEHPGEPVEIVSLGAGNADNEVAIAKLLRNAGLERFRFRCLDINPDMQQRGRELIERE